MTRPPVSSAAIGQAVVAVLILVSIMVTVRVIRESAPEVSLPDVGVPAAPDDTAIVTCERTLPDAATTQQQIDQVEPVGLISSGEVVECPDAFDGQVVVYVGEVVGDVLHRDGGAWALVNDDDYALEVGPVRAHRQFRGSNSGLSVWFPDPVAELTPGRHDRRGTIVLVRGRIHRSDGADGGGLTLRALSADAVSILRPAHDLDRPIHTSQAVAAVLLAGMAMGVHLVARRNGDRS